MKNEILIKGFEKVGILGIQANHYKFRNYTNQQIYLLKGYKEKTEKNL